MSPIILVGAGLLVLALGMGLGFWLSHASKKREETKAADIQKELDEYRRHVTAHFSETAQHFKALGQQYQSLYKHMAHGADALCDPAQSDGMLEFPAGGTAALTASADEPATAPETIRDYAPPEAEDTDGEKVRAEKAEAADESADALVADDDADKREADADSPAADDVAKKPVAEEEIAEAISGAKSDEAERTVH